MSDFITSIGSFLAPAAGASSPLQPLLALAGLGTNIYSGIQNIQSQNRLASSQNYINSLTTNPAKMQAAAAQYTQPLTAGLTSDISEQVQGNLAERGLGSSPAAYTQQLTSALAPYIQQQQQTGYNNLLQALGLAGSEKPTNMQMPNLSSALAALKGGGTPNSSGPADNPYEDLIQATQYGSGTFQPTTPQLPDNPFSTPTDDYGNLAWAA